MSHDAGNKKYEEILSISCVTFFLKMQNCFEITLKHYITYLKNVNKL